MILDTEIDKIEQIIVPMLGQKAYNAKIGTGSFITMDFGSFLPQHKRGEWHIWVYCCAWRIEKNNEVIAACEDNRSKMEDAIKNIEGKAIQSIKVKSPAFDTELLFEDNIIIRLFSIYSDPVDEMEHWMIFTPDNKVLCTGPGMTWTIEDASN